ncbi:hypothetical protein B0H17DRAFT_954826 [Mycena rosella]|uniref:Uncharacterized protein n=1 Tax=Mycena rosella TaxID=1033263 RepID=A0AAD7CQZ4_MYCRO|nr:hypothetical protein B0H17DRAFT_954826 [Mycena rosella]
MAHHNEEEILNQIQKYGEYLTIECQLAIFNISWKHQTTRPPLCVVNVDRECLVFFEEMLFENSFDTGRARNQQWGLDAEPHQDDWTPYADIPTHWNRTSGWYPLINPLNHAQYSPNQATVDRSSTKMLRCQTPMFGPREVRQRPSSGTRIES